MMHRPINIRLFKVVDLKCGAETAVIFYFVILYFIITFYFLWNAIRVFSRVIPDVSKACSVFAFGVTHSISTFDPEYESLESSLQSM